MKEALIIISLAIACCSYGQSDNTYPIDAIRAKKKTEKKDENAIYDKYTQEIKVNAKNADAYYNRGKFSIMIDFDCKGNPLDYTKSNSEAYDDIEKAIHLNSKKYGDTAYYMKGLSKMNYVVFRNEIGKNGGYETSAKKAEKDFDKAIEFNPNYAEAYLARGVVRYKLEKFKTAIEDFTKVIELKPELSAYALYDRGICKFEPRGMNLTDKRDPEGACDDWHKALNLGYKNAEYIINIRKCDKK